MYDRQMRFRFSLAIGTVSWASLSCSSDGGGGSPPGGATISAADFPVQYASAWCGLMQRCCFESNGTPSAACEGEVQTSTTTQGDEAASDGATWNESAAVRCLDAVDKAECAAVGAEAIRALVDSCDDVWTGVVPQGGACKTFGSCAEPQVSGGASAGASCVNATCVQVVRQPIGAPCSEPTQPCDPFVAECASGACVALPEAGQACSGSCRSGSRCTAGTCEPLLAMGAACTANGDCASDRCSGGRCASGFVSGGDYCTLL
jgi:hypothetical protein